jgi:hypothetical protein
MVILAKTVSPTQSLLPMVLMPPMPVLTIYLRSSCHPTSSILLTMLEVSNWTLIIIQSSSPSVKESAKLKSKKCLLFKKRLKMKLRIKIMEGPETICMQLI